MYARAYVPGRNGDIMLVPERGVVIANAPAAARFMHGSPWDYDTHVPLVFYGPPFIPKGVSNEPAALQDIAPTIALLLGIQPPPSMTGRPLRPAANSTATPPRLIFLTVLDGMRFDYFDRYASVMPTLTHLRHQGIWFSQAYVNYAPSNTSPAHAAIGTGTDPRINGVSTNSALDGSTIVSAGTRPVPSPHNLQVPTLADVWNLHTRGRAIIVGQGGVLNAAIGLVGHGLCMDGGQPVKLASYDRATGLWGTIPECYILPDYLKGMNSRLLWESAGGRWMGHNVAGSDVITQSALFARFEVDSLLAIVEHESFGSDEVPDLLLANIKTPDFVGHQFGPESSEMRETLIELDGQFAAVLEALDKKVGRDRYVVIITADHGMPSPPEELGHRTYSAGEIVELLNRKFAPTTGDLVLRYRADDHQLFLNAARLRELRLAPRQIADFLEAQPFIFSAYTAEEVRSVTFPP